MSNAVKRLLDAYEKVEELESELIGWEINHQDHDYCVVEMIEGYDVSLYCEDERGNVSHIAMSLEELEGYLSK